MYTELCTFETLMLSVLIIAHIALYQLYAHSVINVTILQVNC